MLKGCTNQPIHKQTRKNATLDMKNNLLNKAIRIILGIVSILPQKKPESTQSNTNSQAKASPPTALPQQDKKLKSDAIRTDSSTEDQKSYKTISAVPTKAVEEEKRKGYISKKSNPENPKAKISSDEKQEEINKETEEDNIYRKDSAEDKTSLAVAIPLSSLGLSVQLFNRLRASNITTVDKLVTKTSKDLLEIKGINKFGVIEIIMSLNKLDLDLRDSPSVDIKANKPAPPQSEQQEKVIETKTSDFAANPEILEVIPKSSELDEQELIQAVETNFELYCLTQNEATVFISNLQGIIPKDKRWSYAQRCLQYIQDSTQSFFDLYGGKYEPDQTTKINISIAIITKKKVDTFIKNPKNSHLMRAMESHCKNQEVNGFHYVLRSLAGETLYEIGSTSPRKQNSHMVRQKLTLASRVLLIDKEGFQKELEKAIKQPINKRVKDFYTKKKRLPIQGDSCEEPAPANDATFEEIKKLNLKERILKLEELNLPLEEEEYDYHYDAISSNTNEPGNGYWLELENIAQFLKRHAVQIGEPTLMPKQVQLPHSVRGAVTRFGGQAFVASKVGLIYQGQLVGEDGRTFWTKEKIDDLLDTIRSLKDESKNWIPTIEDIKEFLKYTDLEEYKNLKFESLMAAIKREDIVLVKAENENLYEIEVSDETTEQPISEEIPKQAFQSESIRAEKEVFMIDDKRANELKELDEEVRGRLNKIFSTPESDSEVNEIGGTIATPAPSKNDVTRGLQLNESSIRSILSLLRDSEESEYVKISTLRDISAELNLTITLIFDHLNELAIEQTDSLLLEEENEESYYINIDVLNSLLSNLAS